MFSTLKRLYEQGKIKESHLNNAVAKGWITEEEKQQIMVVL